MNADAGDGGQRGGDRPDAVALTAEGHARLAEELERLTTVKRPEAAALLAQALQVAGDLADNSEYLDARMELERLDERIALLEDRLSATRLLRPDECSADVVALGSRVVLEDLDEETREEYLLVSSPEADPTAGRLSNESPVGRAILGRRRGEVVAAQTPHRIRRLRIAAVGARR